MITCCELALYIALGAFGVILALLAMFFNYNLKLDWRTAKLEKKNGHELERIEKLEAKNGKELKEIKKLKCEIRLLKALMTLSEEARQKKVEETDDEWDDEEPSE